MLNLAVDWGFLRQSPVAGVKKYRENGAREVFLAPDEVRRLWRCQARMRIHDVRHTYASLAGLVALAHPWAPRHKVLVTVTPGRASTPSRSSWATAAPP
jgi:hypothetical protein